MRTLAAFGLAVVGAVIIWSLFLAVFFLVDEARHIPASLGLHDPHEDGWIAAPAVFSVLWMVASGILVEYWHRKGSGN